MFGHGALHEFALHEHTAVADAPSVLLATRLVRPAPRRRRLRGHSQRMAHLVPYVELVDTVIDVTCTYTPSLAVTCTYTPSIAKTCTYTPSISAPASYHDV